MGSSSTHLGPPRSPSLRLVGPDEIGASRAVAEYVALMKRGTPVPEEPFARPFV